MDNTEFHGGEEVAPDEEDAQTLQDAEPGTLTAPHGRRTFLRGVGLAGAGLMLAKAAEAAPKKPTTKVGATNTPPKKPKSVATQREKARFDKGATATQTQKAATEEVRKAAQGTATPPKVQTLNVAIIGPGSQGRNLLLNCLKIPGIRFQAVCDVWPYSQAYAVNILKKYKQNPTAYADYREMLEKEKGLDAVIIATPDWQHAPQTVDCLKTGLHVYCEKEMSNTLQGAQDMVRAQRETGKLLQIGHQRRSNPRYWHSYELIHKERMLGRLTHCYGQWNRSKRLELGWPKGKELDAPTLKRLGYDSMEQFRNWRWYRDFSGGPMADLGSHQVDIFSWFMRANPTAIIAAGGTDYYKQSQWYDHVMAIYEYQTEAGKVRGFYQVLNTTGYGGFYEAFMGDEGAMEISEDTRRGFLVREPDAKPKAWEDEAAKVDKLGMSAIALQIGETLNPTGRPKEQKLAAASEKPPHQLHLENFFNAIREGTPLTCPADVAYETCVAVLKANQAVEAGARIEFRKDEFKVA